MTTQRAKTMTRPASTLEVNRKADWHESAACDGSDVEQWFAEGSAATRFDKARAICDACPVKTQCLRDALAEEDGLTAQLRFGLRGGKTREQRAVLGRSANDKTICGQHVGTAKGVARHREGRGKMLCPACHWYDLERPTPAKVVTKAMRPVNHGTPKGADAHRRRGETPCDECLTARREYDRARLVTDEVKAARTATKKAWLARRKAS